MTTKTRDLLLLSDEALAMFGRAFGQINDKKEAAQHWIALLKAHPKSPFAGEARMELRRLGVIWPSLKFLDDTGLKETSTGNVIKLSLAELKSIICEGLLEYLPNEQGDTESGGDCDGPMEETLNEGENAPTNPGLWSRAKAAARSKFKVYPSAYANAWASKWYKDKGGGWRKKGKKK